MMQEESTSMTASVQCAVVSESERLRAVKQLVLYSEDSKDV